MAQPKFKPRPSPPAREDVIVSLPAEAGVLLPGGPVEQVEAVERKNKGGRPKGSISRDAPLSTKIKAETYADMKRIAERDRFSLAELIERAIARYEEHRAELALGIVGERKAGETNDELIRRAFRLGEL